MRKLTYRFVKGKVEERGYELVSEEYLNAHGKLKIRCPAHGVFEALYLNFRTGQGCPSCYGNKRLTIKYIIDKIEERGYLLVSKRYMNAHVKLKIQCNVHGIFKMAYHQFSQGQGCPPCAGYGFNPNKPATLYYLEVFHRGRYYYKIGITNRSIQKRYSNSDLDKITVLGEWDYEYGGECRDEEQRILENFNDWRYRGEAKILETVGNTEIFTENVLQL